eukprot:jgi/Tetstr1/449153/TSEL_036363.t1
MAAKASDFTVQEVPKSQYSKVGKFMVETYYMNGDPKALPPGPRR